MKTAYVAGIILIVLGVIGLAYGGIHYTKRQRLFDAGPIHASRDKQQTIPISPVLGGIAVAGGVVLLVVGAKHK